jgi:hypothetical protein
VRAEQVRWSEVKVCYTKIDATMITPMCWHCCLALPDSIDILG